jgi:hypothetical protein
MFKCYKDIHNSYYSIHNILVVDDDFEAETSPGWDGIISVYEKRKLPVAPNLLRAMFYYVSFWGNSDRGDMFAHILQQIECLPYKEEVERLLLLL